MDENDKSWNGFKDFLATDMIKERERTIGAFRTGVICVATIASIAIIGLLFVNYSQNKKFMDFLSGYDFVTQDGEGFNSYNSNVGGDVNYGSKDYEEKGQEQGQGSSD